MADSVPTVIDLTAVSSDDDIEIISGPSTSKKSPKKRRRKKSKQRESKAEGGREDGEIEEARDEEGRRRKRNRRSASPLDKRRSPSPPTESFYTDFTPAKLPAAVQFHENGSNALEPDTIPLLLPSHVAVFDDDATRTLLPTQPDSDDDYIDYLDIDGPRVSGLISRSEISTNFALLGLCTLL